MKKIIVFTAAGFSQAYMKKKIDTGYEKLSSESINELFTKKDKFVRVYKEIYNSDIPEPLLKVQASYKKIWDNLSDKTFYNNEIYPPNFETVFYLLSKLCNHLNNPKKPANNSRHHTYYLPNLFTNIKETWLDFFSYEDFYRFQNILLDYVAQFEASDKSLNILYCFFSKLMEDNILRYYTLNYDSLFIEATSFKKPIYEGCQFLKNVNYGDRGVLTPSRIIEKSDEHCCFHLHGSVYFVRKTSTCKLNPDKNEATVERKKKGLCKLLNTGERRLLTEFIVGYDKEKILNLEPFATMNLRLALDIIDADELIILGYSLGDEHINKLLLKLTAPLRAQLFTGSEIQQRVFDTRVSRIEKITVVDFKQNENEQTNYMNKFCKIGRETGESNTLPVYDLPNIPLISKGVYHYKDRGFSLRFEFNGVEEFINNLFNK